MKVLFFADNRNRANWGCRSTSMALKDLVGINNEICNTIYGDYTFVYMPDQLRERIYSFSDRVRRALCRRNIFSDYLLRTDPYNIIKDTVEGSYQAYKKMMDNNPLLYYKDIDYQLRSCDALVCNGEGTMIFKEPARYDTIFYTLIIKLAQEYGKKTYLLNSMFSDYPSSSRNTAIINECKDVFFRCTMVTARDPLSYDYYKTNIGDNVTYVPDALFSWTKYAEYLPLVKNNPNLFVSFPEYDNKFNEFDFSKPYICLSGSSLAAWNQEEAIDCYTKLAKSLQQQFNAYIVPTCDGDKFLNQVAKNTGIPIVPVNTNIFLGMSLLANADVFVSGRWHPSILASLGGTPCVFMGSNSHKTLALQYMLNYRQPKEYNAFPTDDDIDNIVADCKRIVAEGRGLRNEILSVVRDLSDKARANAIV